VRIHAYELLGRMGWKGEPSKVVDALAHGGSPRPNALAAGSAAQAVGALHLEALEGRLEELLRDADPDVVRASARALAHLGVKTAVPALQAALASAFWVETRRDLSEALARLGDASGRPDADRGPRPARLDLTRESYFECALRRDRPALRLRGARAARRSAWRRSRVASLLGARGRPGAAARRAAGAWKLNSEARRLVDASAAPTARSRAATTPRPRRACFELGQNAVPAMTQLGLKLPARLRGQARLLCGVAGRAQAPRRRARAARHAARPGRVGAAWACTRSSRSATASRSPRCANTSSAALLRAPRRHPDLGRLARRPDRPIRQGALNARATSAETELVALLLSPRCTRARDRARGRCTNATAPNRPRPPPPPPAELRSWSERWQREHSSPETPLAF
jgi:hypothetical protein